MSRNKAFFKRYNVRREDFHCPFCGKDQNQVERLIAGPDRVYVCNECATAFSKEEYQSQMEKGLRCSFCGKDSAHVQYLSRSGPKGTRICGECIALCLEILAEEQDSQPGSRT